MSKKIILSLIFVIILSLIYLFPRLYQFEQNINFRYDQGLQLLGDNERNGMF
jgi:flagellar biogenesis protein FliO